MRKNTIVLILVTLGLSACAGQTLRSEGSTTQASSGADPVGSGQNNTNTAADAGATR